MLTEEQSYLFVICVCSVSEIYVGGLKELPLWRTRSACWDAQKELFANNQEQIRLNCF
jgi:hypothetical protein